MRLHPPLHPAVIVLAALVTAHTGSGLWQSSRLSLRSGMPAALLSLHRSRWSTVVIGLGLVAAGDARAVAADALALLAQPGHVLILRHASAPGVGDPPGMTLGDCATQRNLDERGRAQAKALGERLRAAGVSGVRVATSQWCRCRETARLLDIGPVEDLAALNSFFEQPETKAERITTLRTFLDNLPRDTRAVVLVTHQMTITALTGHFPASGEGLVLKLRQGGGFERVGELQD